MASVIDKAVSWALLIANSYQHGYDQTNRWGPNYDCSSFIISAYEYAGVGVKTAGATYTGNMRSVFTKYGFKDVTSNVALSSVGDIRLQKGDVLINTAHHTAMYIGNGKIVHASINEKGTPTGGITGDQTGKEICVRSYYNYPWDTVLRFESTETDYHAEWVEREVPNIGMKLATKSYMAYQTYTDNTADGYNYLWGKDAITVLGGLRKYKSYLCMAFGSYYGKVGTFVKIQFEDGKIIYAVKADEKKDSETDEKHMYHKSLDGSVTEFIVDGAVVRNNEAFTYALKMAGIERSSRIKRIWTASSEPVRGYANVNADYEEYDSFEEYEEAEENEVTYFADTNEKISIHSKIFNQPPLTYTGNIYCLANGNDISRYICDISWQNTKDSLSTVFSFSVPKADKMKYLDMYTPQVGEVFRYCGGKEEYFRGIIKETDDGDRYVNKYTAVDAGWYLNETKDTYQFDGMRADECIKKIVGDLNIPIVTMANLDTLIEQTYIDKSVSDIIKDIIEKCGTGYNFDFVPKGIRIYKCTDMAADPKFRISSNTQLFSSVEYSGNRGHKLTFDGLRNSVKVVSDTEVLVTLKDDESIAKYGFLQEVVKIKKDDETDPKETAKEQLAQLNKLTETTSIEIIEELDSYTRAGSVITYGGEKYVITSSKHSLNKGVHQNQLNLERE